MFAGQVGLELQNPFARRARDSLHGMGLLGQEKCESTGVSIRVAYREEVGRERRFAVRLAANSSITTPSKSVYQ